MFRISKLWSAVGELAAEISAWVAFLRRARTAVEERLEVGQVIDVPALENGRRLTRKAGA